MNLLSRTALAGSALVVALVLAIPAGQAANNPPGGSYKQTCRNIQTDKAGNGDLKVTADCQDRRGNWQSSSLRYQKCPNQKVGNDNGTLVCEGGGAALPGGSWQQSCQNGDMRNNGWLYADCRRRDGKMRSSSIDPRRCNNNNVGNDDGNLVCEGNGNGQLPTGSWSQTCRNSNMRKGTLYADCRRIDGGWRSSSIDAQSCGRKGVANDNGNLVCEGGGGGNNRPLPGGSWQQSCRDYQAGNDGVLTATCQRADGGWSKTWINYTRCPNQRVANNNGNLVCQ